jgi:acyl carrier protein
MAELNAATLTFEQFRDLISKELAVPKEKVVADASFIEDLLVDSIRMVEMMLRLEEMGMSIPLEAAWSIETVGDAFEQYRQVAQEAQAGTASATAAAGSQ